MVRSRALAVGVVSGALLATGCGGKKQESVPPTVAAQPPAPATVDPMAESLGRFRNDVRVHHAADILMGACVGWPNVGGGITVTVNPGLISLKQPGQTPRDYLAFSRRDLRYPSRLQQMDGPAAGSQGVATLVFRPKGVTGGIHRHLSASVQEGHNGQRYYTDAQSGQPVMNTAITDGPTTIERLSAVCDALRFDEPIPAGSAAQSGAKA